MNIRSQGIVHAVVAAGGGDGFVTACRMYWVSKNHTTTEDDVTCLWCFLGKQTRPDAGLAYAAPTAPR